MEKQFEERILKKVKSVKLPSFLGDIKVESVDIGQSIPFITQPKLLSMSPEGDMLVEANVDYAGGLRVVIKTDFHWTYSSLMKPISLPLVLSVSLKSIKGKFQLKIKPPPTNRLWFGFYSMPEMDWEITPIVSDKQIKLSMVRNAIQSKIREFMMEVLVLPNMDDISFYPSDGRGGIFGERVPKTSASSYSSPDIKLNKTPELVVTDEHVDLKFNPYSPSMRKAEPTGLFDTQEGADLIESNLHCGALRARGYSSPELLTLGTIKQQQTKDHLVPSPTCASSDTLLPSGNVRLRKRHSSPSQNELPAGFDDTTNSIKTTETTVAVSSPMKPATETVQHEDLCSLSDSDNTMVNSCTEKIELGVSTESDKASQLSEKDVDARSISERSTISNTSTKSKLLSRFSNHSRFEKTLETKKATFQNKKNAFYSMAGNMFKKNGVSRQVREERSRELEEMHQRKMMTLFDMPPPLPPRKNTNCSAPSLDESRSYNSSFEECDPSPVSKEFFDVCDSKVRYDELFQVEHEKHRFSF
jgi:hypothetical protein